jgi:uncharacterized CHY-type Zn-finger protein
MKRSGDVNDITRWYRRKILKTCKYCREKFSPWRANSKFCKKICSNRANGRLRERAGSKRCSSCGKTRNKRAFNRYLKTNRSAHSDVCIACARRLRAEKRKSQPWFYRKVSLMLCNARRRASESGLEFNLTREDIVIPERCPIFGTRFEDACKKKQRQYGNDVSRSYAPSIDRIENEKGYVKDNIVVISCRANSIKMDASVDELKRIAKFYSMLERRKNYR